MSYQKEEQFHAHFKPHLKGINMAVGSAVIMDNIDFILDDLRLRHYISVVVSADVVTHSKLLSEIILKCAEGWQLAPKDASCLKMDPGGW
jgi:beta-phosphoglucomutase